ncbi:MAG: acetyl-CoA carboxylase biotin carboxyl carrier protein [Bacteroidales bacterium]|jgi:biotin carboxyl carrier protein
MKNFKFTINGNAYEADILGIEDNIAEVSINGVTYSVEIDRKMQTVKTPKLVRTLAVPSTDSHPSVSKTASPSAPKGTGNIKSPLPGVILDMYVREGDMVKIGQKLLMLEAMKMENIINADKEGKVTAIKAGKGDSVMEGDILIVIGE